MEIYQKLQSVTKNILKEEPLKKHTSFQIGGPADLMLIPECACEVAEISRILREEEIPYFFMGNGSNLLVSDKGYRGAVIKTTGLCEISTSGNSMTVSAGVMMSKAANLLLRNGLSGFEALSGIPGTVGGAVCMNAGAYGSEIKDVLTETTYLDGTQVKTINGQQHNFSYRHSFFSGKPHCILSSKLTLEPGNPNEIKEKMEDYTQRRVSKQPLNLPSAGSTFKRPEGYFASKLIEDCGLKGTRIGGACVSEKHSGFLVNDRGATCEDMLRLIDFVKQEVYKQFGVELELEVKTIEEDWKGVLS